MEHGNISNTPVPKVAFRFEDIIRKEEDGKLNRSGKAYLENLAHLDFQIVLLTTGDERKAKAFSYKYGVLYSKILAADSILDLENIARELNVVAYYDTDKELLQRIKSRGNHNIELHLWTLQDNLFLE